MLHLTAAQARKVDEICRDQYHIPTLLLMENAARSTALAARQILGGQRGEILILCGPGNNGGDGLAAARHLANGGFPVTCALLTDHPYSGDAKVMHDIAAAMSIPIVPITRELAKTTPALTIDALFGTGLTRPLGGLAHEIAVLSRVWPGPRLAVDLPSGLDANTGKPTGAAAFVATHTITFVAPKAGFQNPEAHPYLGQVFIGDIGAPRAAVEKALAAE